MGASALFFAKRADAERRNIEMSESKVVLVTGISSGIGRETAQLLVERGFRVFGCYPDEL